MFFRSCRQTDFSRPLVTLAALADLGGIAYTSEILEYTQRDRSVVYRALSSCRELGWIKTSDSYDRRKGPLHQVTEKGRNQLISYGEMFSRLASKANISISS